MNEINKRISLLREEMQRYNLDALFISGTDPHSSEYLVDRWKTREFISGFTGSYGTVVVSKDKALLWTDTRYFIQAEEQLRHSEFNMMKLRIPDAVTPDKWVAHNFSKGDRIGVDPRTVSVSVFRNLEILLSKRKIELVKTPDLFEAIWENRPKMPSNMVYELDVAYAGLSRKLKRELTEAKLVETGAEYHIITMPDEIAWLFNLRGSDIRYNPVFTAYGLIGKGQTFLFVDNKKIPGELRLKLEKENIIIQDYHSFLSFLKELRNKTIFLDPLSANYSICFALAGNNEIVEGTSVISLLKAKKSKTEIEGFRKAMRKDGVALVEFLFWLKNNIGRMEITEYTTGRKLAEFRSKQPGFKGESFSPIVGYKQHGAIVHLSVGPEEALLLQAEGILLFDSGGQYPDGTTDITRTVALGKVSEKQKKDFTLVLKGMIALTRAVFPVGTKGCHLDILARQALWENGLNYGHGTGHGVGHFLNVHEGPMAIRQEYNENSIEPGHVLSNEPAFYREGEYGIRTENMMVCVEKEETRYGKFLGFETLTLCPIDINLIDHRLLNEDEKNWLNNYHKWVNKELKPLIKKELHAFLDELTREIYD